jgi:hypothetical protein
MSFSSSSQEEYDRQGVWHKWKLHRYIIERGHLKNLGIDNIKTEIQEGGSGGMDWIDLAEDRDRWRTFVNVVTNHQVPKSVGKFLTD